MATARYPGGDRRHRVDVIDEGEEIAAATQYYRDLLAQPARRPWTDDHPLRPHTIGPVWEITPSGHWLLPELSAGWEMLGFLSYWLNPRAIGRDRWEFTPEQARRFVWWRAVNPDGTWMFKDGVFQRVKGHGKDPMIAAESLGIITGPQVVVGVDETNGVVYTEQHPNPTVQIVATAGEQTKTTFSLFPAYITPEFASAYGVQPLRTMVHARQGVAEIQSITSNPLKLEGFRPEQVFLNETQHWLEGNRGVDMDAVIRRNMRKVETGRTLRTTNSPRQGSGSVAEADRESYEAGELSRFLYDSVEAHRDAKLNEEHGRQVIPMVRGDSYWLTEEMFLDALSDPRDDDETKRRYWYNQYLANEEKFIEPIAWADCEEKDNVIQVRDRIVLFGDGSKSDDYTAIVGCRISDGKLFTIGCWKPNPQTRRVDRAKVSHGVDLAFAAYRPLGLWFDPSPAEDDEEEGGYWESVLDSWAERYGGRLKLQAGPKHPIIWDMRRRANYVRFVQNSEQFMDDVESGTLVHDGDRSMERHIRHAVKHYTDHGVTLRKESRRSQKKIDIAVCAVGARMMRRVVMLNPDKYLPREQRLV